MNSKIIFAIGLVSGIGIGIAGTYSYFKNKYEQLAEEDFNSRRNLKETKIEESTEKDVNVSDSPDVIEYKSNIAECAAILQREGYVNYNDIRENKMQKNVDSKPCVIDPSEFGEIDDYEKISLTYTADGVLLDDMNEIVDDIDNVVGKDSLEHFGEYEEDSVHVRNDDKKCYYEILLDQSNYQEIIEGQPHRTEM